MKKFLILLLALSCQISFSQNKKKAVSTPKKVVFTPPKIKRAPEKILPPWEAENKVVSIVKKNDFPLAFKFQINKDTILLPKAEFAEIIEMRYDYSDILGITIISKSAADTLKIQKNDSVAPERIALSYYEHRDWGSASVTNQTIKVTDKETKLTISFKVVLDKPKKKILYLINVLNGRKYLPTAYEPPAPSIGF